MGGRGAWGGGHVTDAKELFVVYETSGGVPVGEKGRHTVDGRQKTFRRRYAVE